MRENCSYKKGTISGHVEVQTRLLLHQEATLPRLYQKPRKGQPLDEVGVQFGLLHVQIWSFFYKNNFPPYSFFCNKFDFFLLFPNISLQKRFFCYYFLSRCCSLISLLSICSNGHSFVSIRCVDYMCYNHYCGTSTPEILPKPLSAVPGVTKNTRKKPASLYLET